MRRSLFALVAALLCIATSLRAEDLVYVRFADYIEALRVQIGIPGLAVAVIGRTDINWDRGFGYQDVARAIPMRPDTPIHLDGITQVVTATTLLRCAEENRLTLDAPISTFTKGATDPNASIRQLLSHTSSGTFVYRPDKLDPLAAAVKACQHDSFRETISNLFERLAMTNSVPGPDILALVPPAEGIPSDDARGRFATALGRLATPYAVDGSKRPFQAQYAAATLTASTGIISTARDFAQFDLALRSGVLLEPGTLAEAWRAPVDAAGKSLPHGLGWFIQNYNGETVVWQFGSGGDNGSSSMVVTVPARGVTLVLLANSTGLVKGFPLDKGDVTTSPFARIFLSLFTR